MICQMNDLQNFLEPVKIHFIKTHPEAVLPAKKNQTDTGYDLTAIEEVKIPAKGSNLVPIGLKVGKTPHGIWYLILPRSGMGFKHNIQPHLGVIDNPYRGSLDVKLYNFGEEDYLVKKGDRVAQIAYFPLLCIEPEWTNETEQTTRGESGFGSSGK
jgi:dUTP pyrophosphatase